MLSYEAAAAWPPFNVMSMASHSKGCLRAATSPEPLVPLANGTACRLDAASLAGATLLVGVHSTASGRQRRDGIRASWLQWASRATRVCFLVGARELEPAVLAAVEAEAAELGDVLLLRDVADRCVLSLPKTFAWWRLAASMVDMAPSIAHVAKTDDDV